MWGVVLSDPLPIVALVGRYPANQLMGRMAVRIRLIFNTGKMPPLYLMRY